MSDVAARLREKAAEFRSERQPEGSGVIYMRHVTSEAHAVLLDLLADISEVLRCERPGKKYEIHGKHFGPDVISVEKLVPVRCDCPTCALLARIEELAK